MESLRESLKKQKQFYAECIAATDALIKSRERKIAEIADLENKRKVRTGSVCYFGLTVCKHAWVLIIFYYHFI